MSGGVKSMIEFEIEASVVAAIPCPPLPMVVKGAYENEERAFPSYSIVKSVFHNMSKNTHPLVKMRHQLALRKAEQNLFETIDTLGESMSAQEAYTSFCVYMRDILLASPNVYPDIRFYPLEYTSKGDTIHRSVCDHVKAQDILFNKKEKYTTIEYTEMQYDELVLLYAKRILHSE